MLLAPGAPASLSNSPAVGFPTGCGRSHRCWWEEPPLRFQKSQQLLPSVVQTCISFFSEAEAETCHMPKPVT